MSDKPVLYDPTGKALITIEMSSDREDKESAMIDAEIVSLRMQIGEEISKQRFTAGLNVNLGDIDEEYVPNLKTLKARTRIYERMANDPQIRGQLRAIYMTMISGVRWGAEGGTQEQQDLVRSNLLGEGDPRLECSSSWLELVYDWIGSLIYGFTMWGKTVDVVDGRTIFTDLTWLHPRSVDEDGWRMDEFDNLIEVRRSFTDPGGSHHTREAIRADELYIMPWDSRGPNWEGNSFIRPMYRPWIMGEMAEKIDLIDLQNRGVGIPMAHLSGKGGVKERDTLLSMVKSLRGGSKERQFLVLEMDEKMSYLTSDGESKDAGPTLAHHTRNKVKAAGTEWLEGGNTASGSRAASSAMATGFMMNVNAIRILFQDGINKGPHRQVGLVRQLQDMNFTNIKEYTRIVGSTVSPTEQLDNIPLLYDGVKGGLFPPERQLANQALKRLGYREFSKKEWEESKKSPMQFPGMGGPGRPNEAGEDERGRDDKDSNRLKMADLHDTNCKAKDTRSIDDCACLVQVAMQEKKTLITGGSQHLSKRESWPWLR